MEETKTNSKILVPQCRFSTSNFPITCKGFTEDDISTLCKKRCFDEETGLWQPPEQTNADKEIMRELHKQSDSARVDRLLAEIIQQGDLNISHVSRSGIGHAPGIHFTMFVPMRVTVERWYNENMNDETLRANIVASIKDVLQTKLK